MLAFIDFVAKDGKVKAKNVRYVPTWVSIPDYTVLPVGTALEKGQADATQLRDSYDRTVALAGRGPKVQPIPSKLP